MKISNDIIKEILSKTDIVNLISSKISLHKKGNDFFALCPFHNEKNPSFSVNNNKNFYYCFGCGVYGNSINFLMDFEKLSFTESIKQLYIFNNINIDLDKKDNYNSYINNYKNNIYYNLLNNISLLYHKNLINNFFGNIKFYFLNKKWDLNIIKEFNIGFSSNNILFNNYKRNSHIINILEKLGILFKYNNKYIDKFNNRIVFPIYNEENKIIAFGGRTLCKNINTRYINSSESIIFKKRNTLYGFNKLKKINNLISKLLIVEGYTDVISLNKNNIDYCVALLGTSLTKENLNKIINNSNYIIFCYDGDEAGKNATLKTLKKIIPYITDEKIIKFVILPYKEDPDSLIRKIGKINFLKYIENSKYFYDLIFDLLLVNKDIFNIYDRVIFVKSFYKFIDKIPSKLIKFFLKQKLENKLGIYNNLLYKNYNYFYLNKKIKKIEHTNIRILISLLIQYPKLYKLIKIPVEIIKLNFSNIILLLEISNYCKIYNNIDSYNLLKLLENKSYYKFLIILSKWDNIVNNNTLENVFLDTLNNFIRSLIIKEHEKLINKEKIIGLNKVEKSKLWNLNIKLWKKNYN